MALTIITTTVLHSRPGTRRGFVTDADARWAARQAGLDYSLSRSSNSLGMPPAVRADRNPNRSEPAYVVGIGEQRFGKPVLHSRWRRQKASEVKRMQQ